MKRRTIFWTGAAVLGTAGMAGWWQITKGSRLIPLELSGSISLDTRQLILVLAESRGMVPANVWLLERGKLRSHWHIAEGPWPANIGKNGVGWGRDSLGTPNPGGYPDKKEGDGRSPAGVFRVPAAFGTTKTAPSGLRLPWLSCTATLRGVDDIQSKYYNQIVDEASVPDKDWNSAEIMRREDGLYDLGLLISHNPERLAGAGSCIFLHIWKGPGQGTAGCTALAFEHVQKIAAWLDPACGPCLVLGVR